MSKVMSLQIIREIAANLHRTQFYTITADETADASNEKQVVLCFRWVSDDLTVHEDFIGFYQTDIIEANSLLNIIKHSLLRLSLSILRVRGQCYDGASAMRSARSGAAKQIRDMEEMAIYTHFYGHALNATCSNTIKTIKLMGNSFDTAREITKPIKDSPRPDDFHEIESRTFSVCSRNTCTVSDKMDCSS